MQPNLMFQSSPSPKAGCYEPATSPLDYLSQVPILTQPESWVLRGFLFDRSVPPLPGSNPHPARKLGATRCLLPLAHPPCSNPHPARKLGATRRHLEANYLLGTVPILTQPESWVLPKEFRALHEAEVVPILTQPESWVLRTRL